MMTETVPPCLHHLCIMEERVNPPSATFVTTVDTTEPGLEIVPGVKDPDPETDLVTEDLTPADLLVTEPELVGDETLSRRMRATLFVEMLTWTETSWRPRRGRCWRST